MVRELQSALKNIGVSSDTAAKIAVLWLQNVADLPILLPGDIYIQSFCEDHKLSPRKLIEAADRLGLNVGLLDDLLAAKAAANVQKSKGFAPPPNEPIERVKNANHR
jgi:hypothetical protein